MRVFRRFFHLFVQLAHHMPTYQRHIVRSPFAPFLPPRERVLHMALFLTLMLSFGLSGCGSRQSALEPSPTTDSLSPTQRQTAQTLWQRYLAESQAREHSGPFRLTASLRYSTQDSGHRLILRTWGNDSHTARVDIEAGIGQTLARIRRTATSFLLYAPRENKAYFSEDDGNALLRLGMPIPFGVQELDALMQGRFTEVLPRTYRSVLLAPEGGFAYTLPMADKTGRAAVPGESSVLSLNTSGQPIDWTVETGGKRMTLLLSGYALPHPASPEDATRRAATALPTRYAITIGKDKSAVILVKEREQPTMPFTEQQMTLELPSGTPLLPLPQR